MSQQTPFVGQRGWYTSPRLEDATAQTTQECVVTRVWSSTCVNVECKSGLVATSVLVLPERRPGEDGPTGHYVELVVAAMPRMDQPKLTGYRQLSEEEGRLINDIKAKGQELQELIDRVSARVREQRGSGLEATLARHDKAEPGRWLAMARTDLQTGVMRLVRAVAQPDGF